MSTFEGHKAGKEHPRLDTSSPIQDTAKCSMPDKGHLLPMATFAWVSGAGMQAAGCGRPRAALQEAVLSLKATEGRGAASTCIVRAPLPAEPPRTPLSTFLATAPWSGPWFSSRWRLNLKRISVLSLTEVLVCSFAHQSLSRGTRKTAHDPTDLWLFEIGIALFRVGWNPAFSTK